MKTDIAIVNGLLVDSQQIYPGVITVRQGKIAGITQSLEQKPQEVLDAKGLYILPGAVDGHVHMMDPGYPDREDFITGTRAAARGGVTTVIDHHRTVPPVFGKEEFIDKKEYLGKRSVVDFGLLGGLNLTNVSELKGMWEAGALGFKGFTCELHEADALVAGPLQGILEEVRKFGGIVLLHCEDDSLLKKKEEDAEETGPEGPIECVGVEISRSRRVSRPNGSVCGQGFRCTGSHCPCKLAVSRLGDRCGSNTRGLDLQRDMPAIFYAHRKRPEGTGTLWQVYPSPSKNGRCGEDVEVPVLWSY